MDVRHGWRFIYTIQFIYKLEKMKNPWMDFSSYYSYTEYFFSSLLNINVNIAVITKYKIIAGM